MLKSLKLYMFEVMLKNKTINIFAIIVLAAAVLAVSSGQFAFSKGAKGANVTSWLTRCDKDEAGNNTHCEMYSRLNLQNTKKRVAEFAIGYPDNGDTSVARGIIVLPLGIFLQDDVVVFVDEKAIFHAKVNYCLESGCYSMITLPNQIISKMKKGNEAALKFKATNGKYIMVKMSLAGFTKTLEELTKEM